MRLILTHQSILKYMVSSGLTNGYRGGRPRNSVLLLLYQSGLMADPWVESA
jgi:transcription initiation factor TFIIH subunit 4